MSDGFDWPAKGAALARHKAWAWLLRKLVREVTVTDGALRYQFVCSSLLEFGRAAGLMQKEPGTVAWLNAVLKPGDTFLDVGANVGVYTIMAATRVGPGGRVYAVEPHALSFSALLRNISKNHLRDTVVPLSLALGASTEVSHFFYKSLATASSNSQIEKAYQPGKGAFAEEIIELKQIYKLDDLIEIGVIEPPNHVKIDVDGHERSILQGMEQTLAGSKGPRSLSVEVYDGDESQIRRLMASFNYCAASENFSRTEMKRIKKDPSYIPSCKNVIFERKK